MCHGCWCRPGSRHTTFAPPHRLPSGHLRQFRGGWAIARQRRCRWHCRAQRSVRAAGPALLGARAAPPALPSGRRCWGLGSSAGAAAVDPIMPPTDESAQRQQRRLRAIERGTPGNPGRPAFTPMKRRLRARLQHQGFIRPYKVRLGSTQTKKAACVVAMAAAKRIGLFDAPIKFIGLHL